MTARLDGIRRLFALAFVCLTLVLPSELHTTPLEVGGHDTKGVVSVDAQHADQRAHFEYSSVEARTRCAACQLTRRPEVLPHLPQGRLHQMLQTDNLVAFESAGPNPGPDHCLPSRAPPHH